MPQDWMNPDSATAHGLKLKFPYQLLGMQWKEHGSPGKGDTEQPEHVSHAWQVNAQHVAEQRASLSEPLSHLALCLSDTHPSLICLPLCFSRELDHPSRTLNIPHKSCLTPLPSAKEAGPPQVS